MNLTIGGTDRSKAIFAALVAAVLSGFLGIFVRFLTVDKNIPAFDVAELRILISTVVMFLILAVFCRSALRINKKDIPFFAIFGIFKFLSDGTFFYAMEVIEISLATLLQMTEPYFVMLFSLILFKEKITPQKLVAVFMTFIGCTMVTGIILGKANFDIAGSISAVLSGLFLATFVIGGKIGTDKGYRPSTIMFYFFLFGLISATAYTLLASDLTVTLGKMVEPDTLGASLVLGILLTLIPYYAYTYSSSKIPPTLASMVSIQELVVACIVGYFAFGEELSLLNIGGMVLVILSVVVIDLNIRKLIGKIKGDKGTDNVS